MIKRDYVPHTAVNISTLYFPGSLFFPNVWTISHFFIFQALFPNVWTISHFFPLQVFATAFLSPISAFDRNLFRSVSPNLPLPRSCIPNSSIVTPAPRRRHIYEKSFITNTPQEDCTSDIFW